MFTIYAVLNPHPLAIWQYSETFEVTLDKLDAKIEELENNGYHIWKITEAK